MATGLFRFLCFFDLAISADYGFYIVTDEKPAFIIVSSRSGQRIFSFKQDDYEWINSKDKVEIHVAAVLKDGSRKPFRKFISYKDNDSFSGGIIDEMSYNIIDVLFQESLAELESEAFDKNFKGWVLRTLDNFIDLYKYIAHDAPIDKSLIYKAPIIQVLGSEKTIELNSSVGVEGEFKYIKNIINWDDPIKNGYIKSRCSEENVYRIGRLLTEGYKLQMFEKLLLQAKDQGHIFKNYSLSVVLSETAFEVYLQQSLIEYCASKCVKELPVGRGKNLNYKDYREAISGGNVREHLIPYIKYLTGTNVATSREYSLWQEKVYDLRNAIVHNGKQDVNESDAELAFKSVVNFINYIENVLK